MVDVSISAILLLAASAMLRGTFTVGDFALFVSYVTQTSGHLRYLGSIMAQYRRVGSRSTAWTPFSIAPRRAPCGPRADLTRGQQYGVDASDGGRSACRRAPVAARRARPDLRPSRYRAWHRGHRPERGPRPTGGGDGADRLRQEHLLRALLGLLPRTAGEIRWNGRLVADPATFFTPPRAAYTPQVPRLFSESLRDNVLAGLPDEADALRGRALQRAVMERDVADLGDGMDTVVGPRGVKLSGGQIQRTAAARMFVRDPELLVFDDLSSALDRRRSVPCGSVSTPAATPPAWW
jgi:ATP-binding cassette subfamily B protein